MSEPMLHPGDVLLYAGTSFFSRAIAYKTWAPRGISHVELYIGNATTWTARSDGTNFYPFTTEHLDTVMRPVEGSMPDMIAGIAWAKQYCGKPYDYWSMLRYFRIGPYTLDKMNCGESVVNFTRNSLPQEGQWFNPCCDPDQIVPAAFLTCPHLRTVWQRDPE